MTEQTRSQIRATNLRKPNLGTFLKRAYKILSRSNLT